MHTEAVKACIFHMTPVGEDAQLHKTIHHVTGVRQLERLRRLPALIVSECPQQCSFFCVIFHSIDFKVFGGGVDAASGGVVARQMVHRHMSYRDGVRQRDHESPLDAVKRPTFAREQHRGALNDSAWAFRWIPQRESKQGHTC